VRTYDETQPVVYGQPSFMATKTDLQDTRYKGIIKIYDANKGQGYIFCQALRQDFIFFRNGIIARRTPRKGEDASFSILNKYGTKQAIKIMFQ